jgi:hypothetical protein
MEATTSIPAQIVACLSSVLTLSQNLSQSSLSHAAKGSLYEALSNLSNNCRYQFNILLTIVKVKVDNLKAVFQSHLQQQLAMIDHHPANDDEWMNLLQPGGDKHQGIFNNERCYSMHMQIPHGSCFKRDAEGASKQISQYEMFLKAFQKMLSDSIVHWKKAIPAQAESIVYDTIHYDNEGSNSRLSKSPICFSCSLNQLINRLLSGFERSEFYWSYHKTLTRKSCHSLTAKLGVQVIGG